MCLIRVRAKLCRNGPDLRIPVLEEYAASDKVSECYQAVRLDVLTLVCRLEANRRDIHLKPSGGLQNSRGRQKISLGDTPLKQARDSLQSCIRIWNTKKYNQLRISRGIKKIFFFKKRGKSAIIYLPSSCSHGAEVKKLENFWMCKKILIHQSQIDQSLMNKSIQNVAFCSIAIAWKRLTNTLYTTLSFAFHGEKKAISVLKQHECE